MNRLLSRSVAGLSAFVFAAACTTGAASAQTYEGVTIKLEWRMPFGGQAHGTEPGFRLGLQAEGFLQARNIGDVSRFQHSLASFGFATSRRSTERMTFDFLGLDIGDLKRLNSNGRNDGGVSSRWIWTGLALGAAAGAVILLTTGGDDEDDACIAINPPPPGCT